MATPPTALADVVPNSVPGPLAMETLTAAVELVTSWPMASSTRTVTPAGLDPALMGWPAIVPVGLLPERDVVRAPHGDRDRDRDRHG